MVDSTAGPQSKGLLGRVAGAVTGRVVEVVDPDIVLDHVDINALLAKVDIQQLVARIDLDPLLERVDIEALLARVDLDALLADVDLEALIRRSGIAEIVADSTSQIAGSTIDVGRRQVAALDFWVDRGVDAVFRRPPGTVPLGPAALVSARPMAELEGRQEVTGHYAGPIGRLIGIVIDSAFVTLAYAGAGATLDWLARTLFDTSLVGRLNPWVGGALLAAWLLIYFAGSLAIAGRTPGQALVGVRVVARDGSPLRPFAALVRTLMLPVSCALFGLGLVGLVIGREHRALHDLAAGSVVVLDFGDRPAALPAPLSRFLDRQASDRASADPLGH